MLKHGGVEPPFGYETVGMDGNDDDIGPAAAAPKTNTEVSKE